MTFSSSQATIAPPLNAVPPRRSKRIAYLDIFRWTTVTFALASHGFLKFDLESQLSEEAWTSLRFFTRSATPSLMFLFGIMAELVYYNRFTKSRRAVVPRLVHRAFQCYAALILLGAVGFVVGANSLNVLIGGALILAPLELANIFAMYCFLMIALVPCLVVRKRFGFGGLAVLLSAIWMVHYSLIADLAPLPHPLTYPASFFFGIGDVWGPSVLQSLTLVVWGMAAGNYLFSTRKSAGARVLVPPTLAGTLIVLAIEISRVGPAAFIGSITEYSGYRATNSFVYFAYGLVMASGLVLVASLIERLGPRKLSSALANGGRSTFSYFLIGNILILLFSDQLGGSSLFSALISVTLIIGVSMLLTHTNQCYGHRILLAAAASKWSYARVEQLVNRSADLCISAARARTMPARGPGSRQG